MAIRAEYKNFLKEAEKFMEEFNLSQGYFSLKSSGNGRLLERLYAGGRAWPEVIEGAEKWMNAERKRRREKSRRAEQAQASLAKG